MKNGKNSKKTSSLKNLHELETVRKRAGNVVIIFG